MSSGTRKPTAPAQAWASWWDSSHHKASNYFAQRTAPHFPDPAPYPPGKVIPPRLRLGENLLVRTVRNKRAPAPEPAPSTSPAASPPLRVPTRGWDGYQMVSKPAPTGTREVQQSLKQAGENKLDRYKANSKFAMWGRRDIPRPASSLVPQREVGRVKQSPTAFYIGGTEDNIFADGCHRQEFQHRPESRALTPLQELQRSERRGQEHVKYTPDKKHCVGQPSKNLKDKASRSGQQVDFSAAAAELRQQYEARFEKELKKTRSTGSYKHHISKEGGAVIRSKSVHFDNWQRQNATPMLREMWLRTVDLGQYIPPDSGAPSTYEETDSEAGSGLGSLSDFGFAGGLSVHSPAEPELARGFSSGYRPDTAPN